MASQDPQFWRILRACLKKLSGSDVDGFFLIFFATYSYACNIGSGGAQVGEDIGVH